MKKRVLMILVVITLLATAVVCIGSFVSCSKQNSNTDETKEDSFKPNAESDFKYTMTDDGQGVRITKYIGQSSKIIIPETIEDLPVLEVTGLAELDHDGERFYNSYWGRWVTPKNNITITHISFPDSVKISYIGYSNGMYEVLNLSNYDALEYIKFSSSMIFKKDTVGGWSVPIVQNCDKLKEIIIPEGITVLPDFSECESLETITLPSSIEFIPENSFYKCSSLREIIIPENVTKIKFYVPAYAGYGDAQSIFYGTNLNLATQGKLRGLGYKGSF